MSSGAGSNMYDPARDIFTASDEPLPTAQNESEHKRKRSRSLEEEEEGREPVEEIIQDGISSTNNLDDISSTHPAKKTKLSPKVNEVPLPITAANLSQISRKKKGQGEATKPARKQEQARRRSASPNLKSPNKYRLRDNRSPRHRRTPSPKPITRSPTPPARSPPRQRKRPGASAKISSVDQETVRRRQQERERELQIEGKAQAAARGVHDVVKQHYNAVPQRGQEWRRTNSLIKGLRSLNNWVKSAIIQRYSPNENYTPGASERGPYNGAHEQRGLLVLDIGCGKGGDLQKWQAAPQKVDLYVGIDPANVSIDQAKDRYGEMRRKGRGGFGRRDRHRSLFQAEFITQDCFGEWIGNIPIVQEVGIDGSVGPEGNGHSARWGGGGFDVVSMMFCMHYAFENEEKARGMLRNVAGSLCKGGRFIGVIPNSDLLTAKVNEFNSRNDSSSKQTAKSTEEGGDDDDDDWDPEKPSETVAKEHAGDGGEKKSPGISETDEVNEALEWGNSIYKVKFPGKVPADGIFRPPFGWKYFYFLEEAVEEIPEYVVPWEAFRALAADYDLELQYRKSFDEIWEAEKDDPELGPLSERMGVRARGGGEMLVSDDECEAASKSQHRNDPINFRNI